MLRAVRFAAKLNGTIDPATRQPIGTMADLIENVPASRLFDEMLKLLTCGHAMDCLRQLRADGLHKGLLPLLDVVLEQPGGEHFVELALERTDARVRAGKTISPSFLFAALLWQQVEVRWKQLRAQGEHTIPALSQAADSVLDEQTESWPSSAASRRTCAKSGSCSRASERRMGKTIYRMIEQPRFRAACDFLQLRAAAGEFDSVLAQWWMDLANADDDLRGEMIEEVSRLPRDPADAPASTSANRRRRRPAARRVALGVGVSDERGSRARLYRARRQPGRQRGHPQDGAGRTAPDAWHRRRDRLALLPHRSGRGHRPRLRQRAAALDTTLAPLELLDVLQALELRHGRERPTRTRRARWTWTCCSTATSPSKTSAWSCPIPACTCAPSCCVRCWTWPHPARRRPPGRRRLAGRHPRPAHLPAVKAPRDNRLPIPTSSQAPRPAPHRPPESRPHGAGSAGP